MILARRIAGRPRADAGAVRPVLPEPREGLGRPGVAEGGGDGVEARGARGVLVRAGAALDADGQLVECVRRTLPQMSFVLFLHCREILFL